MSTEIDIVPATATPVLCELRCEQCGYQLRGLSTSACGQCGNLHLRCPECGHTQPADTQNVELIKPLHRWHGIVRRLFVVFHMLILIGCTLPWLAVYTPSYRMNGAGDAWSLPLMALFLIGPMRLVTMRLRPAWVSIAVCCGLPLSMGVAWMIWGTGEPWPVRFDHYAAKSLWTVPTWIFAAVLAGWLCRGWFWLMYPGGTGAAVYRWFTGPIYRRREAGERLKRGEIRAGENIRRYCIECGEQVAPAGPELCETCGTYHLTCGHCATRLPVSATGGTMDSLAGRSVCMMLALWSGGLVLAMLLLMTIMGAIIESDVRLFLYGGAGGYRGNPMRYDTMATVCICGAAGGVLGGLLLLRRRHVGWAAGWSLVMLAALISIWGLNYSRNVPHYSVARLIIVLGLTYAAMLLGHILTYPLLWVMARVLLPVKVARWVMLRIGGTGALEEAVSE